jgi:dephospho-CoA kinase
MKSGLLIVITGLPGSGKTTAASYIDKSGYPVVYMGRITKLLLEKEKLKINEDNEKYVRGALRKKYGKEIYAEVVSPEIKEYLKEGRNVFLEGLRSPDELNLLKKHFKYIKIIYIDTKKKIRYQRVLKRKKVPLTTDQIRKRDEEELKILGLNKIIKQTDYVIKNDTTQNQLFSEIKNIIKIIERI